MFEKQDRGQTGGIQDRGQTGGIMKGTLYGVGVGPGDPELLTLKAVRVIKECQYIAVPSDDKNKCLAYKIASGVVQIEEKPCLTISMPMTMDAQKLEQYHADGAQKIAGILEQGKDVAFLVLGDPTIYATYGYIHEKIKALGYETQIVSGIPSFCAAAARLNIPLAEQAQQLHILPAAYVPKETAELSGTKVFMKIGSQMEWLKEQIDKTADTVYMVENCGLENERVSYTADGLDEAAGYYSIVIAKSGEQNDDAG